MHRCKLDGEVFRELVEECWCAGGGQDYMSSKLVIDSLYVSVQKSKWQCLFIWIWCTL